MLMGLCLGVSIFLNLWFNNMIKGLRIVTFFIILNIS